MKRIKNILLSLLVMLALTRCANMVAPTGGPKDVTPPKVVEAVPGNQSTGFDGRKLEVTFDEYITLNNASQQVLFSPPLAEKPDIKLKNKTVVIRLNEDLKPNTTYTIDFGESVKDLHEGNLFKDYIYSFATGDHLDTLTLSGTVVDAETRKPVEKLYVGLYRHCDPTLCQPDYLTRTDKEGRFRLTGLPDTLFFVFALEDMNSNLRYDLITERVAFIDTLVRPDDSLQLQLYAFVETDTTQMLLESKLVEEGLLRFAFRQPADSVRIEFPDILPDSFYVNKVWSPRHDTLCCWFTPDVMDSLSVEIHYDTLIDVSARYGLVARQAPQRGRSANVKELKVSDNLRSKKLMPGDDLTLLFAEPIAELRLTDTATLIGGTDTLFILKEHFTMADSLGFQWRLDVPLSDTLRYTLNMPDSVFFSLRGRTHKAFSLGFNRAGERDFGNIIIKVQPPVDAQAIVQLLDNKGKVVASQVIDTLTRVEFSRLLPDKYKLRAIIDADRDGKWSTGNFHRRFLPEAIIDYKDELDLKAGWDIDLDDIWGF